MPEGMNFISSKSKYSYSQNVPRFHLKHYIYLLFAVFIKQYSFTCMDSHYFCFHVFKYIDLCFLFPKFNMFIFNFYYNDVYRVL